MERLAHAIDDEIVTHAVSGIDHPTAAEEFTTYTVTLEKPANVGFGINMSPDCVVKSFGSAESCAHRGGVVKDSVILKVNDKSVKSRAEIISVCQYLMPGDCATFLLRGDGPGTVHKDGHEVAAIEYFEALSSRFVELGGLTTDGVFREAGSHDAVSELQASIDARLESAGGSDQAAIVRDVLRNHSNVHNVATLLGRCLRNQPKMIAPHRFRQCHALADSDAGGAACDEFVAAHLSSRGGSLLRSLVGLLQQIDATATRMTADNLSKVFAPTIIQRENPQEMATHIAADAAFVSHLIRKLPPGPIAEASSAVTVGAQIHVGVKAAPQAERSEATESDEEEFGEDDWDEARAGDAVSVSRRMQLDQSERDSHRAGLASLETLMASASSTDGESEEDTAGDGSVMDEFALLEAMLADSG